MLNLPGTTKVYRPLPKELFYKYLHTETALKKSFTEDIDSIIWSNTLSAETMPIKAGQDVKEIAVVEIVLKRQAIAPRLIEIINREMDRYTLFIVRYEDWGQYWCCDHLNLKEQMGQLYCQNYYQSRWMIKKELILKIEGTNLDQVYASLFKQIVGKPLAGKSRRKKNEVPKKPAPAEPTDDQKRLHELESTFKKLENQISAELQFGRQLKLVAELEKVKNEIQLLEKRRTSQPELKQRENKADTRDPAEVMRPFLPNLVNKIKHGSGS